MLELMTIYKKLNAYIISSNKDGQIYHFKN